MKKCFVVAFTVCAVSLGTQPAFAKANVNGYLYRSTGLSAGTTQTFDMTGFDRLSVQVAYSSSTNPAFSFTDGAKSTASISVGSTFASLANSTAAATITVTSNSVGAIGGAVVTIAGHPFTEGVDWFRGNTSSDTAVSLRTTIALYPGLTATTTTASPVVYASATVFGSAYNYTIVSSTPAALTLSAATLTGGRDAGTIQINSTVLTAGIDFAVGASTVATATNIAAAINANATLGAIVLATATPSGTSLAGVVTASSTLPGVNAYSLTTSSRAMLTQSWSTFQGGVDSEVDSVNNIITRSTHTLTLGMKVLYSTTVTNVGLTGLTWGTTYFAIPQPGGTSFKLADTSSNAVAGVALDISSSSTGGGIYAMTPSTFSPIGTGFYWASSNDGTNYWTIPAISSVTIANGGGTLTNIAWDFGFFNYRYLRFIFNAPAAGGVVTDIAIQGKKDD